MFIVIQDEKIKNELETKYGIIPKTIAAAPSTSAVDGLYYYSEFPIEDYSLESAKDPEKIFFRTNRLFF